jgi:hypothetical protein
LDEDEGMNFLISRKGTAFRTVMERKLGVDVEHDPDPEQDDDNHSVYSA